MEEKDILSDGVVQQELSESMEEDKNLNTQIESKEALSKTKMQVEEQKRTSTDEKKLETDETEITKVQSEIKESEEIKPEMEEVKAEEEEETPKQDVVEDVQVEKIESEQIDKSPSKEGNEPEQDATGSEPEEEPEEVEEEEKKETVSEETVPKVEEVPGTESDLKFIEGKPMQSEEGIILDEEMEEEVEEEEEPPPFSYFDKLDAPRELEEPITLTEEHLKEIIYKHGLIKLCWPKALQPSFENFDNIPASYLDNDDKEKVLLLYAENFRKQFCYFYPKRKPLLLACDNECGIQKMVCTTVCPTKLPYPLLDDWKECASFIADHIDYVPLEEPTLMPRRLCSPHSTMMVQKGHCFEIATVLCSLLIGYGYDAFVTSGYAIEDATNHILTRIDPPYVPPPEVEEVKVEEVVDDKYKLAPPVDLSSKFLAMMQQRTVDKEAAEKQRLAEEEQQRILEEEKRPEDELEGRRIHSWVLVLKGEKGVDESFFIEPSFGLSQPLNSDFYHGIESVWNHENYWINMQTCSMSQMEYDLTDVSKWEHILIGEPLRWRKIKPKAIDEEEVKDIYDEKHLDMPKSWSRKINIPNDILNKRYPNSSKVTQYKRTVVEQYAPYSEDSGLVQKFIKYRDFACWEALTMDEIYEFRHDKLKRVLYDIEKRIKTEYFDTGREDGVIKHIFYGAYSDIGNFEAERIIIFNSKARSDSLGKLEYKNHVLVEHYENREDKLYYRQINYSTDPNKPVKSTFSNKKTISVTEKFDRNPSKPYNEDIAIREFFIDKRMINLKFHYGRDRVTRSTRTFIKPNISEMGEVMVFNPDLTYGYQAELGAPMPSYRELYLLYDEQLREEERVMAEMRDMESQYTEFLTQRMRELNSSELDISLYNEEYNVNFRNEMLDKEEKQRMNKEKEVEETDYLAPHLATLGYPKRLTRAQALKIREKCLEDFKQTMVNRTNKIQIDFINATEQFQEMKVWYKANYMDLSHAEKEQHFQNINKLLEYMRRLELRLKRNQDVSHKRYLEIVEYLDNHPKLKILKKSNKK